jgi:hypothetical protein
MLRRSQLQMFRPPYFGRTAPVRFHRHLVVDTSGRTAPVRFHRHLVVDTSGQMVPVQFHRRLVVGTSSSLDDNWS